MWWDRLNQSKVTSLPELIEPHRYQWINHKNERLNKRSDIVKDELLVSDGSTRCRLSQSFASHSFALCEKENQAAISLFNSAIETIDYALRSNSNQEVSPMLPAAIVDSASELLPVETNLFNVLEKGHLHYISKRPRLDIRYDEEVTDAARAKRLAKGALTHLASHSECWQRQTLTGVVPKKVLARLSDDEYSIYENIIYAKLLDKLASHLRTRIAILTTLLSTMDQAKDFYTSNQIDFRLASEVCRLWGMTFDEAATNMTAKLLDSNLKKLNQMLHMILGLQQSNLYILVGNKKHKVTTLHPTNILSYDTHYQHVLTLWKQLETVKSSTDKLPEQEYEHEQHLSKAYSNYVGLVLTNALQPYLKGKTQSLWVGRKLRLNQNGLDWQIIIEQADTQKILTIVPWLNHLPLEENQPQHNNNILIAWPSTSQELCKNGYQGNRIAISPTDMYCVERIGLAIDKQLYQMILKNYLRPITKIPNLVLPFAKTIANINVNTHSFIVTGEIELKKREELQKRLRQANAKSQAHELELRQEEIHFLSHCPICQSKLFLPKDGFKQRCDKCGLTRTMNQNNGERHFEQHYPDISFNFLKTGRRSFTLKISSALSLWV